MVPMALKYEVRSNDSVYCFPTIKSAAAKTLELEKRNIYKWSLRNRKTEAYIYKQTPRSGVLALSTGDNYATSKDRVIDKTLLAQYNAARLELQIEKRDKVTTTTPFITNEQMRKMMNLSDNDKDYKFFVFGRDNKVYQSSGFQGFLAWHRNRSPNRTHRGIRLFFDKAEADGETVLISTVFLGVVPANEVNDGETPPLFETLVVIPSSEIFFVWRYDNYKDAEEGHTALKSCTPQELIMHIEQEIANSKSESLAYVGN